MLQRKEYTWFFLLLMRSVGFNFYKTRRTSSEMFFKMTRIQEMEIFILIIICMLSLVTGSKHSCSVTDSNATDGIDDLTVYCNNSTSMRLTWIKKYGATMYNIRIIDRDSNCFSYNVTDEEFVFDSSKGLEKGIDYWAIVTPFPRPPSPLPSLMYSMAVSSCPKIAQWTEWSSWGVCNSKGCNQKGKTYRQRICAHKMSNDPYGYAACQPPIYHTESKSCWKECVITNCPKEMKISSFKTVEVKKVLVYCTKANEMRLTWERVQNAGFYMVRLLDSQKNCTLVNVTDEELIFSGKVHSGSSSDYWGSVTAFQRRKANENVVKRNVSTNNKAIYFGRCPKIGTWGEWEDWGECDGPECDSVGIQYRSKECVKKGSTNEKIHLVHCKPPWVTEQSQVCFRICDEDIERSPDPLTTSSMPDEENKYRTHSSTSTLIIIGSVFGLVLLAVGTFGLLFWIRKRQMVGRRNSGRRKSVESSPMSLYVSYMNDGNNECHVMSLVQYISSYGIDCVIDLLFQMNIHQMGGLPNWLPIQIRNADKILIVLSKAYIKALNSSDDTSYNSEVCKIHAEFQYIRSLMYQSLQRAQLIIVLDGVKYEEIPVEFQGRFFCNFPKRLNEEDDSCCQLIGLLLDEEPLVMEAKESPSVTREARSSTTTTTVSSENSHEQPVKKTSESSSIYPLLEHC